MLLCSFDSVLTVCDISMSWFKFAGLCVIMTHFTVLQLRPDVSLSLSLGGKVPLLLHLFFLCLHAFILHPLSSTSLPRTGEGQCLLFSLHTVLFLNQACEAWSLPANPPSTIINAQTVPAHWTTTLSLSFHHLHFIHLSVIISSIDLKSSC